MADESTQSIVIDAPPERILAVIADFDAYPEWTNAVKHTEVPEAGEGGHAEQVRFNLDAGPIIEQDVVRVDHASRQDDLVAAGRDVEAQVLARAVGWHSQSRVMLNGHRTVVFR